MAWKSLPATEDQLAALGYEGASMKHVSGIGTYRTTFVRPQNWGDSTGAYLSIPSTNGGEAQVFVNGQKAESLDLRRPMVDITDLLTDGVNTIEVKAATTLANRMHQRNYGDAAGWDESCNMVWDYGMTGDVQIIPYEISIVK